MLRATAVPPGAPGFKPDLLGGVHAREAHEVARALGVDPARGLGATDAAARLARDGENRIHHGTERGPLAMALGQFTNLVVALLAVAAALSFAFGEWLDGVAVVVVILLNAAIGFATEYQAARSMAALARITEVFARVRRDGHVVEIPAHALVHGDLVLLEGGDVVPADLRIVEASGNLQADESALTGESEPVLKRAAPVPRDAPLAERHSLLHQGTGISRGYAVGVVVATGMGTELGRIAALVADTAEPPTPLERQLSRLGRALIGLSLAVAVGVGLLGILRGHEFLEMARVAIALAVAAIPEGLPVIAGLSLAHGLLRMARENAVVRRLAAVEALGSTTVIMTDKTGTLTENRMTVTRVVTAPEIWSPGTPAGEGSAIREALEVGVLCNNAVLREGEEAIGDPLEAALLHAGLAVGLTRPSLVADQPAIHQVAFDAETKMMATYHASNGERVRVAVKGAPEAVLAASSATVDENGDVVPLTPESRAAWAARNESLAGEGLRVLAVAHRPDARAASPPYEGLTFLALVGLMDPPRTEVREALATCREAGIRVVMVTGDQPVTAQRIGHAVGLVAEPSAAVIHGKDLADPDALSADARDRLRAASLYARVTPKQKLDLVVLHQRTGEVVAMTGDGVNDAPALKRADVGVAMGLRGTQVAQESSDIVLKDDRFPTIVKAIEEGRSLFGNIRTFVVYLLSCNLAEILLMATALTLALPVPLLPLQILFLNLVTDVLPALALGFGRGHRGVMQRGPRDPREALIARRHWLRVAFWGSIMALATLTALLVALAVLRLPEPVAVTLAFLTLGFAQLWHVVNVRPEGTPLHRNPVTRNRYVWAALLTSGTLLVLGVHLPPLAAALSLTPPTGAQWALVLLLSFVPVLVGEAVRPFRHRRRFSHG